MRRGLVRSRARASELIAAGRVSAGGEVATRPAEPVDRDVDISVLATEPEFVGRGGYKLAAALDEFRIDPAGKRCIDVGASTGGFTDCLLHRGAASVVAVDVGTGQLASSLRDDPRVLALEKTDIRRLDPAVIGSGFDLVVVDVSFISLCAIAEDLRRLALMDVVALCKPQFEVGRDRLGKRGVVTDPRAREAAVASATACLQDAGLVTVDVLQSPVAGTGGNIEFLLHLRPEGVS